MSNAFSGLSSLRKKEKDTGPKPVTEKAKQLQDYLAQQYGAGPGAVDKLNKKKKVKKSVTATGAVRSVDNDVTGFSTSPPVGGGAFRGGDGDDDEGKLYAAGGHS